jgi:hypothetical protein
MTQKTKKIKKIRMINYLNEQTAHQIGAMYLDCGYKVVYIY